MPVERPTFHESWYRVADIHPRLRSKVQISRQHFRGQPWYVVQDHANNAFFRLAEPAYRFIGLLDGKRTVGDAWKITNDQLGDDAPTQGEVIQLLGQLYTANLLQADVSPDTHTLFSRYKKRKQREISSYLMNIMFARLPIIDPDAFLNKWLPLLGWIFSPVGLLVWLVLIALGIHSIAQRPGWQTDLFKGSQGLLSPENLVLLYIAFAFIKACHEMGHAISCKKFGRQSGTGGEVHVIGIMFLVFTPVPYVDASSSWALTNKWHRAIVGAAGMWVELGIAAVAAMVWARTSDAFWVHAFAYNVMFVASFSTIVFNANPLLRYDGYYILSDLLEIPNLATRSKDYVFYLVKRYVWNVRQVRNPAHSTSEQIWMFVYAIASFLMRCFVTFSIMFYLTSVLEGTLIILATAMAIAGLFTWAAMPVGKFIHYVTTSPELSRVRSRALITSGLVIAAIVVGVGFVPFPDRARAQGVVEPDSGYVQELIPGGDGLVQAMNVEGDAPDMAKAGDREASRLGIPVVHKGTSIFQTYDPDLDRQIKQMEAQLEGLQYDYNIAMAQSRNDLAAAAQRLQAAKDQLALRKEDKRRLQVATPISGVLIAPDLENKKFAFLKASERAGVVANLDHLIVRAAAGNELAGPLSSEVPAGSRVEIRLAGRPDILLEGRVRVQGYAGSKNLPAPSMGFQVSGGQFNTAPDDRGGTRTVENFFEIWIDNLHLVSAPADIRAQFTDPGQLPLLPGQRVVVRFELKPRPIAVQVWTSILQVFQKKFQL